jgi:hypothetical protein
VSHCVMVWAPPLEALWSPTHEHHVSFWLPSPWPSAPPGRSIGVVVTLLRLVVGWCAMLTLACDPGGGVAVSLTPTLAQRIGF